MNTALTRLMSVLLIATTAAGCTTNQSDAPTGQTVTTVDDQGNTITTVIPFPDNPFEIPSSNTPVSGSGATFPKPLIETWAIEFAGQHSKVQVSYAGGGSGKGITDITNKDVVFAGSDAPMSPSERAKANNILHIPETLGLNAVVYNVDGMSDGLMLTGDVVGKIFVGDIEQWNDPAIAALNPGVSLPENSIAIVYRSDSSGTTYVYTDWLTKTSADWRDTMGSAPSKKPDWTKSTAKQFSSNGNDGVGTTVRTNPNTIGYVELAYVKSLDLDAAKIKNKAGEFTEPTTAGAQKSAAAAAQNLPAPNENWSTVSITDADGAGAYPISSFSYILVYNSLADYGGDADADELEAFRAWLWWCLHEGQTYSEDLGYAPLPQDVVKLGEDALKGMQV